MGSKKKPGKHYTVRSCGAECGENVEEETIPGDEVALLLKEFAEYCAWTDEEMAEDEETPLEWFEIDQQWYYINQISFYPKSRRFGC